MTPSADTWSASEATCSAKGGHLLSVLNTYEEAFLISLMLQDGVDVSEGVWTGLSRVTPIPLLPE